MIESYFGRKSLNSNSGRHVALY